VIIIDVVFFWDWIAYVVAKSVELKRCIWWERVTSETLSVYVDLYKKLRWEWRKIKGVVCDGRRWVLEYFKGQWIAVQKCHFHQEQTWRLYLWKKSKNKHESILELKYVYEHLGKIDYEWLNLLLWVWKEKWSEYLKEKNLEWHVIHVKQMKAYRSLLRNIGYLETHEKEKDLWIPTTTNWLDWWVFSWLKSHKSMHRWMNRKNACKFIENYFWTH
jgi:hypothetical protein